MTLLPLRASHHRTRTRGWVFVCDICGDCTILIPPDTVPRVERRGGTIYIVSRQGWGLLNLAGTRWHCPACAPVADLYREPLRRIGVHRGTTTPARLP